MVCLFVGVWEYTTNESGSRLFETVSMGPSRGQARRLIGSKAAKGGRVPGRVRAEQTARKWKMGDKCWTTCAQTIETWKTNLARINK